MLRDPYMTREGIQQVRQMLRYIKGETEDSFVDNRHQSPAVATLATHRLHFLEESIGMDGEIIGAIYDAALSEARDNPMVMEALKNLLMITKLSIDPSVLKSAYDDVRYRKDRNLQTQRANAKRLEDHKAGTIRSREHYRDVVENITPRWNRVIKSLEAAARKDPVLSTMAMEDQKTFELLRDQGYVVISRGKVVHINRERLEEASLKSKMELIDQIHGILGKYCPEDVPF